MRRRALPARRGAKWQAVADAVVRIAVGEGRPVLIGTRTVRASEAISAVLRERGIAHVVLNAKQDGEEAEHRRRRRPGRARHRGDQHGRARHRHRARAGRAERGGLHVILTEYHESRRIDRQLFGRCARQGDPGSCEAIVALDDELFTTQARWLATRWRRSLGARTTLPAIGVALLRGIGQRAAERRNRDAREGRPETGSKAGADAGVLGERRMMKSSLVRACGVWRRAWRPRRVSTA